MCSGTFTRDAPSAFRRPWITRLALTIIFAASTAGSMSSAEESAYWQQSPYQVHVTLAVDASALPGSVDEQRLAREILEGADAFAGGLWRTQIDIAPPAESRRLCSENLEPSWDDLPAARKKFDKLYWLTVRAENSGFDVQCREYDVYTRYGGALMKTQVRQPRLLGERCFQLLRRTFSPLALIQTIEGDDQHVRLSFRGQSLPRPSDSLLAEPNTVFLPLLRRTNRSGELLANGVTPMPWTYLQLLAEPPHTAKIASGIGRPFSIRRRGFVEQLAIALPQTTEKTTVRLHARHDPEQSLAGYEVYLLGDDEEPVSLGRTNADGAIEIPRRRGPIATVYIKSDEQLLAKAPIPVGSVAKVEMPLADDPARLTAQAMAQSIRERLIDLVARRSILAARVRQLTAEDRIPEAQQLMSELNSLPGPSEFNLEIEAAQRDSASQSNDPRVQERIDQMYAEIQSLLARFLSRQPLTVLQGEVDAAAAGGE